jgi:adenylate cyclase
MYVISRAPYQERMVEDWINSCSTGTPQLLLANQNTSYSETLTPVWLENRPEFSRILRHLNFAGGGFKSEYTEAGQNFLMAGRSLDDIDWSVIALEKSDNGSQGISRTAVLLFAAIVFLVIIITVISRYFASIFLTPVRQLSLSVAAMAEGNYDLRLDVATDDEIGQLCRNFNSMAASLKEKEYLNRFLSDIAREAISGRVSPRATRVEGAVLFSDIRNFTTMTEQKEPEEIVQMLNEFMTEAEAVVVKHGGTIEKFIGDAIMVVFLPALGSAAPTARAVRAAEELLAAVSLMNTRREKQGLFSITIGAGIATGSLLMGTIGNQQGRRDYSVTGKTVLRAAAMEKLTRQVSGKKIVLCPSSAEVAVTAGIRTKKLSPADSEEGYEVL